MGERGYRSVDHIRGLIIYRASGVGCSPEFLLLKKRKLDDWSPPKGKKESAENEIETAQRETVEETGLIEQDYQLLNSSRIYFEYRSPINVLKKVTLWPAKLVSCSKVIRISKEHEKYRWLPIDEAVQIIKDEYRGSLIRSDQIIRHIT